MTLKQVFKAQQAFTKYMEDGCMEPITSCQAANAYDVISKIMGNDIDDVTYTALSCIRATLWSIYLDRKPEP